MHGKAPINDGELYYEIMGTGEPLILIHMGFSDRRDWQQQISDFASTFKTISYDQRGSGHSSVIERAFNLGLVLIGVFILIANGEGWES